jgi:TPR repeat protein
MRSRALGMFGCFAIASGVACGSPGAAADALKPKAKTGAEAFDEGSCPMVSDRSQPLVVDWKDFQRSNLEEAMHDGIAVVSYDCDRLKVLRGCSIAGTYGYLPQAMREESVRLESADEIRANLPTGLPLIRELGAEMQRGATLDIAMVMVGKRRTTIPTVMPSALRGGAACEGASHFIRASYVGAFFMAKGSRARAKATAFVANAESKSEFASTHRDGDVQSCKGATSESPTAPAACNAVLRLELSAIGAPKKAADGSDEDMMASSCGMGLVFADGKCTRDTEGAHFCAATDPADCAKQCKKGHPGSCWHLGLMYSQSNVVEGVAPDDARAVKLFDQACEAGYPRACSTLGFMVSNGRGTAVDQARALKLHERACNDGATLGCLNLGITYAYGNGVTIDKDRAATLFQKTCDGGRGDGCTKLGLLLQSKDAKRAADLFRRGCDGSDADGCTWLARALRSGDGVTKDLAQALPLFLRACDGSDGSACTSAGEMFAKGEGVPRDGDRAAGFYHRACELKNGGGCDLLADVVVRQDKARERELRQRACDYNDAHACAVMAKRVFFGFDGEAIDRVRSEVLYKKGCELGALEACADYATWAGTGFGGFPTNDQAFGAHAGEKACEAGLKNACSHAAYYFKVGRGVARDRKRAEALLQRGCELGNDETCKELKAYRADK